MKYCEKCGKSLETDEMVCHSCGWSGANQGANKREYKDDTKRAFLTVTVAMLAVIIGIFAVPMVSLNTDSQWLKDIATIRFSDVINIMNNFHETVFEGVLVTMTMVPLIAAIVTLVGALIRHRATCMISSAVASGILIYLLFCFVNEYGMGILFGENSIISFGFWIALIGHVVAWLSSYNINKETHT